MTSPTSAAAGKSAARLRKYLVWTYFIGSAAAVAVTFFLVGLGLEFSLRQWIHFLIISTLVIPCLTLPDVYLIGRHVQPITSVLAAVDRGEHTPSVLVSKAIVRALNLPFFAFVRVTLFHGPTAAILAGITMWASNHLAGSGYAPWQIVGVSLTIVLFAALAHAIAEFFVTARKIIPEVEQLWAYCDRVEGDDQRQIISIPYIRALQVFDAVTGNLLVTVAAP